MKTEAVAPKPSPEASNAGRPTPRDEKDAPADLFAMLLSAAEGEAMPAVVAPEEDAVQKANADEPLDLATMPTDDEPDLLQGLNVLPAENKMLAQETKAQENARRRNEGPPELGGPGQWVSTVAKARSRTPPPQALTEMMQAIQGSSETTAPQIAPETAALRSAWHAGSQGQPAGQLAATLGEPESMDLSVLGGAASERAGEQRDSSQSGQGGQRGDSARVILEAPGQMRSANAEAGPARSFASLMGEAMGKGLDNAFNQLGDQVSLWAAGQTRKASLILQTGLQEAMEVDVSLNGDQAQLVFRTDDLQAREAIRTHAHALLTDMLNRAGLGLESLSVGGRDAGQSGGSDREGRGDGGRQRPGSNEGVAEVAQRLGSRAGVGLSIYA